ncbi:ArsR/SmtB family transcription factor [Chitinophaga vietnamensis]|uniref:ArsR/SmtB family transcription factor n=1 Tax=Chitinophaga vietnamensis TaxID=2593957 RepID=UPI0011789C2E|nr:metalloregulator ArsR/SmtB family transcription factor [Chitinophaga vietnamensis]
MRRDVFQAIADPNRRAILGLVARQPLHLNAVAEQFDITRSAVSQHMKILVECGLVVIKQQGRERYCEARMEKLGEVYEWLEQYRQYWHQRFDAMEAVLKQLQSKDKKHGSNKRKN